MESADFYIIFAFSIDFFSFLFYHILRTILQSVPVIMKGYTTMKLRAPSVPLITVDPYFSVWSPYQVLNHKETVHWTGKVNDLHGYIVIDGTAYAFLGYHRNDKKIPQTSIDIDALSTKYTFENEKVKLSVRFMTPLLPDDLNLLSRPVSYMSATYEKKDPDIKDVSIITMWRRFLEASSRGLRSSSLCSCKK